MVVQIKSGQRENGTSFWDNLYRKRSMIHKLGFNQNYNTFALIPLMDIILCSKFPWTKFTNYKCFEMRSKEDQELAPGGLSSSEMRAFRDCFSTRGY